MAKKKKPDTESGDKPTRVHKCLGGNGFETDGTRFWLSPGRVEWRHRINAQMDGLQQLVNAVNAYAAELYQKSAGEQRAWWLEVWKDIGVDPAEDCTWTWRDTDGSITRVQKEKHAATEKS